MQVASRISERFNEDLRKLGNIRENSKLGEGRA